MKKILMVLAALVLAGALFAETTTGTAAPTKTAVEQSSSESSAPAKKAVKKTKKAKKAKKEAAN